MPLIRIALRRAELLESYFGIHVIVEHKPPARLLLARRGAFHFFWVRSLFPTFFGAVDYCRLAGTDLDWLF